MKTGNNIKRIICAILCLCMMFGIICTAVSCGKNKDKGKDGETQDASETADTPQEGEVAVLRFVENLAAGTQITSDKIKTDYVREEDIPLNAIRDSAKVIDKYLTIPVFADEYIFAGKLSAEAPKPVDPDAEKQKEENYLLVTDHVEVGKDVTTALQNLINKNPGRTLYFPDGKYILSKPIVTSADPAKSVSFRLSNYAVITAASSWTSNDAMIRIGAGADPAEGTVDLTTSSYFMGGIIDASGKATALSVEGGRDNFISNVSIKNAVCGLYLAAGTTGATNTDVENVNIYGKNNTDSVGVKISGINNTLTTVRVSNVITGVEITGEGANTLRNVHVVYTGTDVSSNGFYDKSSGNSYDMCFAEGFGTGFRMQAHTVSSYSACLAFWNDDSISRQYGFASDGAFKSAVRNCRVNALFSGPDSAYLKASGGDGQVIYPLVQGKNNMDDKSYTNYLRGTELLIG